MLNYFFEKKLNIFEAVNEENFPNATFICSHPKLGAN